MSCTTTPKFECEPKRAEYAVEYETKLALPPVHADAVTLSATQIGEGAIDKSQRGPEPLYLTVAVTDPPQEKPAEEDRAQLALLCTETVLPAVGAEETWP